MLPYSRAFKVGLDYDTTWSTIDEVFERYELVRQLPYHCIPATIEAGLRYLTPDLYTSPETFRPTQNWMMREYCKVREASTISFDNIRVVVLEPHLGNRFLFEWINGPEVQGFDLSQTVRESVNSSKILVASLPNGVGSWHMNVIAGYKVTNGNLTDLLAHDPEEVDWTRIDWGKLETELNRVCKGKTDLLRIAQKKTLRSPPEDQPKLFESVSRPTARAFSISKSLFRSANFVSE